MKQIKYILILVASACLFSSCDDYLDITPKGKLIPDKVEDYDLMLNVNNNLKVLGGDLFYMSDDFSYNDDSFKKLKTIQKACYLGAESVYDENSITYSDWSTLYKNISVDNLIIDGVKSAKGSEKEKLEVEADARARRAMEYLLLVNLYAKQYDPSTAATDHGVPLVKKSDINQVTPPRGNVKEVYDFIMEDCEFAIKNLPDKVRHRYRFTKAAAYALYARVKMLMTEYEKAIEYADKALDLNKSLFDFNTGTPPYPELSDDSYVVRHFTYVFWGSGNINASKKLYDLFPHDGSDIREKQFTVKDKDAVIDSIYFKVAGRKINIGISVPEILLSRAECNARKGTSESLQAAINDLNYLRENRIKTDDYTALLVSDFTKESLIQYVLDERRRELCFRGLRLFDLRRLNKESAYATTITRVAEGDTYTIEPNSNKYVFPIPYDVIGFNPDMPNNPRD